ncbi:MAG: Crp/Fnr family transcriptional regulator [Alphaproteobacteria bacterium]|jgi:CRP-like cAMP-binding protein|nr:Crp/Fnr family transcriptional regulator [Alphaproteobacteria bacterium]
MSTELSQRLDAVPFLSCLDAEALREVEKHCRWRRCRAGEQILDKDSSDSDVYFVVEGAVQIVNYSLTGREIAFAKLEAGSYFGELSAIDGAPRSASVVAARESLLAAMSGSLFTRLVVSEPEMVRHLLLRLAGIVRVCNERIMDLSTLGAVPRVYVEILRLAEDNRPKPGTDEDWRVSPMPTQKAIAGLASTTRETVARSLSQLVSGGIIERRGKTVLIRDFSRLERLAGALDVAWAGDLPR